MDARIIIGQILGFVATAVFFISYQMNTKKTLMLTQILGASFMCFSFLLLGAVTGFVMNITCVSRNIIFYFVDRRSKLYKPCVAVVVIAMAASGALSWTGPMSLLVTAAIIINTLFISIGDPQLLRKSLILTSSMIGAYDAFVMAFGGMTNEIISVISSVIGAPLYRNPTYVSSGKQLHQACTVMPPEALPYRR